jgi:hypothetical protein
MTPTKEPSMISAETPERAGVPPKRLPRFSMRSMCAFLEEVGLTARQQQLRDKEIAGR